MFIHLVHNLDRIDVTIYVINAKLFALKNVYFCASLFCILDFVITLWIKGFYNIQRNV